MPDNHPNRPLGSRLPATAAEALTQARERSGLSQTAAAKLLSAGLRTWQQWEAGDRGMPINAAELWAVAAVALGYLPRSDPFVRAWVRPPILSMLAARQTAAK